MQQAGIAQHGTVASSAADQPRPAYLPLTLTRGGASIKIAFLSFSWGTNGIPDPYNQVNLLWQSSEYGAQGGIRQSVLDAIAQARRETDLVIVAAHWGYEYQFYPDASQIEGAQQMAAAGADVILGAQPHTLQPVDMLTNDGRKTLVIYSLANFLASQGAFQAESFSATSVIFYVGITRHADGSAGVSGYRYLPTIHVDDDTRPAPIPPQGFEDVIAHVRLEMRDFQRRAPAQPRPAPRLARARVRGLPQRDAARRSRPAASAAISRSYYRHAGRRHYAAPAGRRAGRAMARRSARWRRSWPATAELLTSVLYTERQRLELHPELDWPFRVSGTQIGALIYQQKYGVRELQRRTNLDGDAIADEHFKAFFQAYGGLPIFGYPISAALIETDGRPAEDRAVLRARALRADCRAAPAPACWSRFGLGALGREYPGIAAQCAGQAASTGASQPAAALPGAIRAQPRPAALAQPPAPAALIVPPARRAWWFWPLIGLMILLLLGTVAWGFQIRANLRDSQARAARTTRRKRAAEARRAGPPARARALDDEDLLRRLLEE